MTILAIGGTTNKKNKNFTGASMMFDGLCNYLTIKEAYCVDVIDLTPKFKRIYGTFSLKRVWEYLLIIYKLLIKLIFNRYEFVYLSTSQSRIGLYRDYTIIKLCKCFKLKVFAHQFGANYTDFYNSLSSFERKRLVSALFSVEKMIVEGEYMKEQFLFLERYKEKVVVVPNGLPFSNSNIQQPKSYQKGDPIRLYYLSNMIVSKGYFDVLQAIDILVNKYKKDVYCVFAGKFINIIDDPIKSNNVTFEQEFNDFIETKHLTSHVMYFNGLFGEEKESIFTESHFFLLPTYYISEGQPVSILEAMSYGCVPIVTKYRHIPMMVTEENGIFVNPKSPQEIADSITELLNNPELFYQKSQANIDMYLSKFTFDKFCNNMMSIFRTSNNL